MKIGIWIDTGEVIVFEDDDLDEVLNEEDGD